jgi:glycosyltransferase involved in cell wall biosynthesis
MLASASSHPMNLVVPLPPSYRGGTEEYAYRLAERFSRGHSVRIFTTDVRWDANGSVLNVGDADLRRLGAFELLERPLLLNPRVRHQLWREIAHASVLQLHMPFPLIESKAVHVARAHGVPTVLTYHMDADLGGARHWLGTSGITAAYRALSAHPALDAADVVVSNSWGYAEHSPVLSQHLGKVRVIHKGVDPARLGPAFAATKRDRPSCVPAARVSEDRARLLFVGRLVPYKGIPILLESLRLLADCGERLSLLIAGRGPMEAELRARTQQLGLTDEVTFLGFVPDSELGSLYRYADLVVAPSIGALESTATALEEAAMCGTAVVGSDLPGTGETVPHDGRGGLLVTPGDPYELARAIRRMLDAGRPARALALRTWDDTAREYLALFRELGARLPPGPGEALRLPFGGLPWAAAGHAPPPWAGPRGFHAASGGIDGGSLPPWTG